MHDRAGDIGQHAAALGADAVEGQEQRAGDVQPLGFAAGAKAGFVKVLDRCGGNLVADGFGKPWKRLAASWLIRAIVAVAMVTPNRSFIRSVRRFSGRNW